MSASDQASEPSSLLLLPPLPVALWAPRVAAPRLREPPPSALGSGKLREAAAAAAAGLLICVRLACAPPGARPAPAPARSSPRSARPHAGSWAPSSAAPAARCASRKGARVRGGREPRARWEGNGEAVRCSLLPRDRRYLRTAEHLGSWSFGTGKAAEVSAARSTAFRLLGKTQDFREERGGEALFGRRGPSKPRRHKGPPAPPRTPGRSGRWESVNSRPGARKRVSGASGALSPPGPLPRGGKRRRIPRSEGAATRLPRCPAVGGKLGPDPEKPLHPLPPPQPQPSSSSAARGPGALHPGAPSWTCTRPAASPVRPPAPRKSPTRSPAEAQKVWASPLAGERGGQAFLAPACVRGGTWTFSPSTSIYLFSSYYAPVGPEEGPDVGLRAGRCPEPQAWQGPDARRLCPQPLGLGGSLPVPRLLSSQVCTTVPHSYSSALLSSCF